jgi:hypothetical protein
MNKIKMATGWVLAAQLGACAVGNTGVDGADVDGGTGGDVLGSGGINGVPGAGGVFVGTGGIPGSGGVLGTGGILATGGVAATGGTTGGAGEVNSTFANNGYGQSGTANVWHGYLFTVVGKGTITPECDDAGTKPCFTSAGAKVCASGSLTAADDAFAMIGYNVNQASEPPNTPGTYDTSASTGVTFTVANVSGSPLRIKVDVAGTEYCAAITSSTQTIAWSSFKTMCWGSDGTALPAGANITSIAVQAPGKASGTTAYDYCIVSIAPS